MACLQRRFVFCVLAIAASLSLCATTATGQTVRWSTGKAFEAALERPMTASWGGVPLRRIMERISRERSIAILADRRINPDQTLQLEVTNASLRDLLNLIAERAGGGLSIAGNVAYIGPVDEARRLGTLIHLRRNELRSAEVERSARLSLTQPQSFAWSDLDEPTVILERLSATMRLRIDGLDRIPHDLWRGGSLPSSDAATALSLVLVQFGFTFKWIESGKAVRIVSIPERVFVEQAHRPRRMKPDDALAMLKRELPDADVTIDGRQLLVRGTLEDQEAVKRLLAPGAGRPKSIDRPATSGSLDRQTFTLTMRDQPASALLQKLEASGITIRYDADQFKRANIDPDQPISIDVNQASAEEFFNAIGEQLGVTCRIDGLTVTLVPRAP